MLRDLRTGKRLDRTEYECLLLAANDCLGDYEERHVFYWRELVARNLVQPVSVETAHSRGQLWRLTAKGQDRLRYLKQYAADVPEGDNPCQT